MTEPTNPTTHETMTRALADWVTTNRLPGLAVQVSHGDQVVFEYLHGRRGDTGQNDADTLFGVASVSKSLTATAVMLLHQRGQLNIEDPIAKWLPQLQFAGDAHNRITIEHLLRHTSGLPGLSMVDGARTRSILADPDRDRFLAAVPVSRQYEHVRTVDDLIAALSAANLSFLAEPGAVFNYSNEGYALLQGVIEAAAGQDYRGYVKANILGPLGIDRTAFTYDELSAFDKVADLYVPFKDTADAFSLSPAWWDVGDIYTNGSWKVTPGGLSTFARMLTRVARNESTEGAALTPDTLRAMTGQPTKLPDGSSYGLGMEIGTIAGRAWFGHTGSVKGVSSAYRCIPEEDLAVTVLINASGADPVGPAELLTRLWLGSPEDDSLASTPQSGAVDLGQYVGEYASSETNTLTVARTDQGLTAVTRTGAGPLVPAGQDLFKGANSTMYAFLRDDDGTITGVFAVMRVLRRVTNAR
ncbi:serine hydrolase [Amycolatopsis sp. GM8]|uniref:serine hydrolase domain-containing protein n=1 Tax=Amycolatopsis sp. GM8 TaxID=2896530 RepID=UPI001F32D8E3|nr:serine hydrolase domain-containing protein [Amycolatopsis sp. GM8]